MIDYINSLNHYFNINNVRYYNNLEINNLLLSSYNDNQIIQNYINKINQYKLFIQMLKSDLVKNEIVINSIRQYQYDIKKILELIKKRVNESKNININQLSNNNIIYNKMNLTIDDNKNEFVYNEENFKKKIYLDKILNSLCDTLLEIDKQLINDFISDYFMYNYNYN